MVCWALSPEVAGTPPVRGIWSFLPQPQEWSFICQAFCQKFHRPPCWKEISSHSEDAERELWIEKAVDRNPSR